MKAEDNPFAETSGKRDESSEGVSDSAALLELSRMLNSSQDLDFILANVLLTAMGKLLIGKSVALVEASPGVYSIRAMKGIAEADMEQSFTLEVGRRSFFLIDEFDAAEDDGTRSFIDCCLNCGLAALIPVTLGERMVGVLGVGPKATGRCFDSADITFLTSLAAVAASAVLNALTIADLQKSNRRLDAKVQEMNTLFEMRREMNSTFDESKILRLLGYVLMGQLEMSREMNSTFDESKILRLLGYVLMGQLRAMRYAVYTDNGGQIRPALLKLPGLERDVLQPSELSGITEAVRFCRERQPANEAERRLAAAGIKVLLPMRAGDRTLGLLCLGDRLGGAAYEDADVEYLAALSNIAMSAIENSRFVREMVEKRELERELSLARTIQKGLLPAVIKSPEGYDIAAVNESSLQVGGDYYDVIPLSEHEYVLGIGDVSGKGVPASLLMANVQAALRAIAPLRLPMDEATQRLNAIVYSNTQADTFITFFWGILDARSNIFTYVNAGHNPPYLFRADGEFEAMMTGGLILGVLDEQVPYDIASVILRPGDTIIAYTDGVNEAMSQEMKEYGNERLEALLRKLAGRPAAEIIDRVREDILRHTTGAKQSDDITMLALRRQR